MFGGLCTELTASDLPEGASPQNNDVDYLVGSVRSRDGFHGQYSFAGDSIGPSPGTAAADISTGGGVWSNPTNILLDDSNYATTSLFTVNDSLSFIPSTITADAPIPISPPPIVIRWINPNLANVPGGGPSGATTLYNLGTPPDPTTATGPLLHASGLGSIPSAAIITGIEISIIGWQQTPYTEDSLSVKLTTDGIIYTSPKTVSLPFRPGPGDPPPTIFGGSTDLWGRTWSVSDITTFSAAFYGTLHHPASFTSFNSLSITIYFSLPYQSSHSDILAVTDFGFSAPAMPIMGIQAALKGYATGDLVTASIQLLKAGTPVGVPLSVILPSVEGTLLLGDANELWGAAWLNSDVNNVGFGLAITVSSAGTSSVFLNYATSKVFLAPSASNINYLKTFEQDDGTTRTLVLDSSGTLWQEDIDTAEGILNSIDANIFPGSFAKSATQQNEEWIALSDLQKGTYIPLHGSNQDRISQVGPGAGPSVAGVSTGSNVYTIAASPNGLTQPAVGSNPPLAAGHVGAINWSAGPFLRSAGNVLTIFYTRPASPAQAPDPNIVVGGGIRLTNLVGDFASLNGNYIVQTVGTGTAPHQQQPSQYFTVTVDTTGNVEIYEEPVIPITHPACSYEVTLATMTTTSPAAIQPGNRVTIAGDPVPAWNATWTILKSLNGAQLAINSTSLTSGIATYTYTLISGSAPTAGEQVSITGCTNGPIVNGTSIFNVSNTEISTAGIGTFTVALSGPNVTGAAETGRGIVNGTIFTFDPGLNFVGSATNPIFGNSGGGTVSLGGNIGSGVRQAVTIFQTRNGYQTAPSPPVIFETTGATSTLTVSNIAIGPPNVVRRIIAFTGSNGGNFFYIPNDVEITGVGQPITYTKTVIDDNVTTSASFTFTDAILLAATAIDIQGNNLFNQIELGSCAFAVPYASRMFYGLENNKIQNLTNTSFDGGYLPNLSGRTMPLGWIEDTSTPPAGSIVASPIFGNAYRITNDTGSTQGVLGRIWQNAYQDVYKVPIILPNKKYSLRITARSVGADPTMGLVGVDVYSPSLGVVYSYGHGTVSLTSLSSVMQEFVVTLITTPFITQIPTDLLLGVFTTVIEDGVIIEIDRIEVFSSNEPVLTTELQGSYVNNLEAFDGVTGPLGVAAQNNQPAIGAFTNYDVLYILKTNSMVSTKDSPGLEPANWNIREVSNKVGLCGINAYDYGEEWAVFAHRSGLYIFTGSEPIPISTENKPTWDAINWKYGHTIWVRNDSVNRKILVAVPMATPNQWLPDAEVNANPTSPNVILLLNYKELNTSSDLAERGPIKASYSGRLISWDISRKWSIWQIKSPYADFIKRSDGSSPLFLGSGYLDSKVYKQVEGLTYDDFGEIPWLYDTYGFVKDEQEAQYQNLGDHRKLAKYLELNVTGAGNMVVKALPNVLNPTYPYIVPGGVDLDSTIQNNIERPLQVQGSRIYLQFSSGGIGSSFQLSEVKMCLVRDPHAPVRGI